MWRRIGASPVVLDWIENGLNFPLYREPMRYEGSNQLQEFEETAFMNKENEELLRQGVAVECDLGEVSIIVSPVHAVPKKGLKKWRRVMNSW
jgi:hypothetical protein